MARQRLPLTGRGSAVLSALALLVVTLVFPPPAARAAAPSLDDVRAEAARGGYRLLDLAELRTRLDREPGRLLVVDTRQDWEFRTGHIPGAVNFSFEPTRWARLKNRGALRQALGADTTRPLVFY